MTNGRCKLHGGASLAGPAHPNFKDGRHSKYLQLHLGERYDRARSDPQLIELKDEIALVDVRVSQLLEALGETGNSSLWRKAREQFDLFRKAAGKRDAVAGARLAVDALDQILLQGLTEAATWDELHDRLELRRRLVESEVKRQKDLYQMITVDQAMRMMALLVDEVKARVKDPELLAALSAQFVRIAGGRRSETPDA